MRMLKRGAAIGAAAIFISALGFAQPIPLEFGASATRSQSRMIATIKSVFTSDIARPKIVDPVVDAFVSVVFLRVDEPQPKDATTAPSRKMCAGFFVDASAYQSSRYLRVRPTVIATNSHCVESLSVNDEIDVGLYYGNPNLPQLTRGRVLAYGDSTAAKDIAFIELLDPRENRAPLPLAEDVRLDEPIRLIGHPSGQMFSISGGVVSGLHRPAITGQFVLDALQTDAALNHGNSGGPALNLAGQVLGINTIVETFSGGSEGLNFVLPAEYIARALKQFSEQGNLSVGWIGVSADIDGRVSNGRLIATDVMPSAPASRAGLRTGDELAGIDGIDLMAMDQFDAKREFLAHILYKSPGETVSIFVRRREEYLTVNVALEPLLGSGVPRVASPAPPPSRRLQKADDSAIAP